MRPSKLPTSAVVDLNRLLEFPELSNVLESFLMANARVSLFAGAVRDVLWNHESAGTSRLPRDLDIGIGNVSRLTFDGLMREIGGTMNRHRGYKFYPRGGVECDFWRLEDTLGLRLTRTSLVSIENVLRSFVLDCNAIAYDPYREQSYDLGALASIRARKIGVLPRALVHSRGTFAAKAIALRLRFDLTWASSAESFVKECCNLPALRHELSKLSPNPATAGRLTEITNERNRPSYESRRLSSIAKSALDSLSPLQS